jgi:hypothetical protein
MGLQILSNRDGDTACFYNSTTDWAFGPISRGSDGDIKLIVFSKWLDRRPEQYTDEDLAMQWSQFSAEYYEGFKAWTGDIECICWENVSEWMGNYIQALEESHAGGAV